MNNTTMPPIRYWIMGVRPKTLPAALIPVAHAFALSLFTAQSTDFFLFFLCLIIGCSLQCAVNLFNDAYDTIRGADTAERIGPKRLCHSEGVEPKTVIQMAQFFCVAAFVSSLPIVWVRGPVYLVLILIAVYLSYAYTGGRYPLAYWGLGDLFVFLFFGVVAYLGTFYAVTGKVSLLALAGGAQCGLLATALLVINNLRDYAEDRETEKNTLVVLLGPRWGQYELLFCIIISFSLLFYWLVSPLFFAGVFPWLLFPLYLRLFRSIQATPASPKYNAFLFHSSLLYVGFAVLQIVGMFYS